MEADKESVIKAINEGTEFTQSIMSGLTVKLTAHIQKENLQAASDKNGTTQTAGNEDTTAKTEKEKEIEAVTADLKSKLNIKNLV
jgi:hypothetical protein